MLLEEITNSLPNSIITHYNLNSNKSKIKYILQHLDTFCPDTIEVYHGTLNEVLKPVFGLGKDNHDYGKGLYTTFDLDLAKEWAAIDNTKLGYIFKLTIDLQGLSIFNFSNHTIFEWLAELISHRFVDIEDVSPNILKAYVNKYKPTITEDIVIGWRADSAFFTIVSLVANSRITASQLDHMLRSGDFGYQLFIRSANAFNNIIKCELVSKTEPDKYIDYTTRCNAAIEEMYRILEISDPMEPTINFSELIRG